ncbi:hypothetical protein M9458_001369, partial [Cirrhinus mrigala]
LCCCLAFLVESAASAAERECAEGAGPPNHTQGSPTPNTVTSPVVPVVPVVPIGPVAPDGPGNPGQ